ncbi:hypothetical protein EsH8_V_001185 [Colletotrichum jinshuiense]
MNVLSWSHQYAEQSGQPENMLASIMLDLLHHSEYIEVLRNEISSVIGSVDDLEKKSQLNQLKVMDSFMKESQRLSGTNFFINKRGVARDITLPDGTVLPQGAVVVVPAIVPDSEDGDEFDGYRYSRRVESSENPSHWRFTSNGNDMPWFGVGKHECPGRFFGDMMLKIALIHLLTCFDWKFEEGIPKPVAFDILLYIINKLIDDAEARAEQTIWCISYDFRTDARLSLYDFELKYSDPQSFDNQKCRFDTIRLPSQISRKTRAVVHQRFIRFPMVAADNSQSLTVDAWVLFERDTFRPQSTCGYTDEFNSPSNIIFTNALLLPTLKADRLLRFIRCIQLVSPKFFSEGNVRGVGGLLTLQNLRDITFSVDSGGLMEKDLSPRSANVIEIPDSIDVLANWRRVHEQSFLSLWPPFEERGVRLYGKCIYDHPILEVLRTPDGIRMPYLNPDDDPTRTPEEDQV